jgi:hypothetical protein
MNLINLTLPWSIRAMWGYEHPFLGEWIVSAMWVLLEIQTIHFSN